MTRFPAALCLAATIALAQLEGQPGIAPPQLGWVRDSNHGLRPVTGLAANFILGDSVTDGVISSAFSGSFGIVKTDSTVSVLDRDGHLVSQLVFPGDADAGPALFAFSNDGAPAFVYLAQSRTLLKWNTDRLEPAPFNVDLLQGPVQTIASPTPDRVSAIVKRDDGLWLIDFVSATQTPLPEIDGPVLLRNDGALLYTRPHLLVLRQPDQSEQTIELSVAVTAFESMGQDWVHLTAPEASLHFALRLEPGREQLYQLPEPQ